MPIMTLEQWHSNDRKGKINARTCVKNKKLAIRKTATILGLLNLFRPKSKKTTYNKRLATKTVADWELKVVLSRVQYKPKLKRKQL